ncbi:hypothetical protein B0T20DRAFT_451190 [Sordaria brevicollis]|uniref:Cerato-platanin n=1 Tax=Sordaria brevicollis TaxID=83679 RepID=A0AAE0UFQ2_SORBR|nr:hypothetical protein B0T20DRAFT_451190 [Sordaria brevicollis]
MKVSTIISAASLALPALALPQTIPSASSNHHALGEHVKMSVTPHAEFSSSVGVLGCKINTNRVAYWPDFPSCDNFCVKLTHESGRSVHVMHIDQSRGARDISYDAWNYLYTGHSVTENGWARAGSGIEVDVQYVPADECRHLITDGSGKLPIAAANGLNWVTSCLGNTWKCDLLPPYTLPTCPHQLGDNPVLTNPTDHKLVNYLYPTGEEQVAP